ncbi:hypothetical protein F5Y11DRAFT_345456 [Daldinia sp. FL1419]|nr:hypothetical protein F5Y11DRAFT_345456 [Daldinia sp. FL1419]
MSKPAQLRSLYRSLLRELPPKPLSPSSSSLQARSPLHQRLRQAFSSEQPHEHAVAQADQLVQYLKAQRQYTTLLERYNPGMNMDEEERVRLTARRVDREVHETILFRLHRAANPQKKLRSSTPDESGNTPPVCGAGFNEGSRVKTIVRYDDSLRRIAWIGCIACIEYKALSI